MFNVLKTIWVLTFNLFYNLEIYKVFLYYHFIYYFPFFHNLNVLV